MTIRYVDKKSELTAIKEYYEPLGFETYRTRLTCGCKPYFNRRDGVLIVSNDHIHYKLIRCKACTTQQNHDRNR